MACIACEVKHQAWETDTRMKEELMNSLMRRNLGRVLALAILGAALFVGGEYISYSHPSGLLASTPIVAPVPAVQEGVKTPAPGFTAVAKAMTPAVGNITSRAPRA